jgi:hypothetical protein
MYAGFAAAARRGAVERATTGADSGSSNKISSSSLLRVAFFAAVAFFGGGFDVPPDALRAVAVVALALDAGLAAAVALDDAAAGFFPKKSVIDACAVGFVFLAGLIYASLSSSSLSTLLRKD